MKKIIYYRGCHITNNHDKKVGFMIISPTKQAVYMKDAVTFEQCKEWIDRQLACLAIYKAFTK